MMPRRLPERHVAAVLSGAAISFLAFGMVDGPAYPRGWYVMLVLGVFLALAFAPSVARATKGARTRAPVPERLSLVEPSLEEWLERDADTARVQLYVQCMESVRSGLTGALFEALCGPAETIRSRLSAVKSASIDGHESLDRLAVQWRGTNPPEHSAFSKTHTMEAPMLVEAFANARKRSDVTCFDLRFVAAIDQRLWYAFQNVGRRSWFIQGAGITEYLEDPKRPADRTYGMLTYPFARTLAALEALRNSQVQAS